MTVVLAILRVPVALGLLVALLLTVGCGPGTARQIASDRTPVTTQATSSNQQAESDRHT